LTLDNFYFCYYSINQSSLFPSFY